MFLENLDLIDISLDLTIGFLSNMLYSFDGDIREVFFRNRNALAVHRCGCDLSKDHIVLL